MPNGVTLYANGVALAETRFTIKMGDTYPDIVARLWSGNSTTPVNIEAATVKLVCQAARAALTTTENTMVITNAAQGEVKRVRTGSEFAAVGRYQAEIQVTFPSALIGTFPDDGYITIDVLDDLN